MHGYSKAPSVARVAVVAALLVTATIVASGSSSGLTIPDLSASVSMDCSGWAVTGVPFNADADGDGEVTIEVTVWDGTLIHDTPLGAVLAEESFTFPAGSTHDLSGAFGDDPTVNPLVMIVRDDEHQVAETFEGSCAGNEWRTPFINILEAVTIGSTDLPLATWESCFGTTLALVLHDPHGAVAGGWVTTPEHPIAAQNVPVLTTDLPFEAGSYRLDSTCGTFEAPSSETTTQTFTSPMPAPTTTTSAPPASVAAATETAATFTG